MLIHLHLMVNFHRATIAQGLVPPLVIVKLKITTQFPFSFTYRLIALQVHLFLLYCTPKSFLLLQQLIVKVFQVIL